MLALPLLILLLGVPDRTATQTFSYQSPEVSLSISIMRPLRDGRYGVQLGFFVSYAEALRVGEAMPLPAKHFQVFPLVFNDLKHLWYP